MRGSAPKVTTKRHEPTSVIFLKLFQTEIVLSPHAHQSRATRAAASRRGRYAPAVCLYLRLFATFCAGSHLQFLCRRGHDWMFIRCAAVGVFLGKRAATRLLSGGRLSVHRKSGGYHQRLRSALTLLKYRLRKLSAGGSAWNKRSATGAPATARTACALQRSSRRIKGSKNSQRRLSSEFRRWPPAAGKENAGAFPRWPPGGSQSTG